VKARTFSGPACIVVNGRAGAQDQALRSRLETALMRQELSYEWFEAERGDALPACAQRAVTRARHTNGIVVAVGGDGTVNAVAQALHGLRVPLGVLPAGTFNYFARAHALPADPAEAVAVWANGAPQPAQAGQVNEQVFIVNASLGIYPKLLRAREHDNARLGRSRLVAAWSALRTLLREHRSHTLLLHDGRSPRQVRTPTLFVGNNAEQLDLFGMPQAQAAGQGVLAAVCVRPFSGTRLVALALRGLMGALDGNDDEVLTLTFRELRVTLPGRHAQRPLAVAFDGEVRAMTPPLLFRVAPEPLWLLKPAPGGS
jgi:diacylglycerol kinase family enzyme